MTEQRPNILLIMTDEQRFDTIAALGFPYMETPNLDRLVNEGVSFTNCFVTGPTCVPSRASFFTGLYPHTSGIYKNADTWRHSWVENLSESGYYCVNIGKMHTTPFETPLGFHERFVVENKDRYLEGRYFLDRCDMALQAQGLTKQQRELYRQRPDYVDRLGAFEWELPEHTHPDFFVGNLASWWLNHKPKPEQPLFMQIGFPGPHPPFDPIPRYAESYMNKDLPLPEVTPEELEGQPESLKILNRHNCAVDHDSVKWSENPTKEQLHRMRAYYLANVTMIDEKIGEILQVLEQKGYLENTVIIFTSDHGDCMGDHGQIEKWNMFDQVTHVPMVVWAPERFGGGRKVEGLCQHFDLAPVILELAGLEPDAYLEARSVMPALRGEPFAGRDHVFCEQGEDVMLRGHTEQMTMVRNRKWKMVHYLGKPYGELYDLESDPGEHANLWDVPECVPIRRDMTNALLDWSLRSGLKTAGWTEPFR